MPRRKKFETKAEYAKFMWDTDPIFRRKKAIATRIAAVKRSLRFHESCILKYQTILVNLANIKESYGKISSER